MKALTAAQRRTLEGIAAHNDRGGLAVRRIYAHVHRALRRLGLAESCPYGPRVDSWPTDLWMITDAGRKALEVKP